MEGREGCLFVTKVNHRQWEGHLPSLCPTPFEGEDRERERPPPSSPSSQEEGAEEE